MNADSKPGSPVPSFSTARRWKIGLDVVVRTLVVLAVIVMANYIGSLFSRQFFLSPQTRVQLSPHTVSILQSLTNHVDVTVYYDKEDGMYSTVMALLDEYHRLDPRIKVKVVDYARDPGAAAQIVEKYHIPPQGANPNSPPAKNLVIFDCEGRVKLVPGDALVQYGEDGMTKDKKIEFRPVAFKGEMMFTATLLAITNPKPFIAYFLQGDGEPSPADASNTGYLKFGAILGQNYIGLAPVNLLGTSDVPADCNLLIIAGPTTRFSDSELTKIDHYISQGGRLLVLLGYSSVNRPTGLEGVLAHYGVNVGADIVQDRTDTATGNDVLVRNFNSKQPVVNPLIESTLQLFFPRPVGPINATNAAADAPTVTVLAESSADSVLSQEPGLPPQSYPLMVAVEQNSVKGIANANGNMRMVVIGESLFLDNQVIEQAANRDFAGYAVNWLLDRPTSLLKGIGPRPVVEFRLLMTKTQLLQVRWLLIGALPCIVLAFGGLVWLRRRR